MIGQGYWRTLYNQVFSVFPPPDSLISKVTITIGNKKKDFKSPTELLTYLSLNSIDDIEYADIEFILKDDRLKNEINEYIIDIKKKMGS